MDLLGLYCASVLVLYRESSDITSSLNQATPFSIQVRLGTSGSPGCGRRGPAFGLAAGLATVATRGVVWGPMETDTAIPMYIFAH